MDYADSELGTGTGRTVTDVPGTVSGLTSKKQIVPIPSTCKSVDLFLDTINALLYIKTDGSHSDIRPLIIIITEDLNLQKLFHTLLEPGMKCACYNTLFHDITAFCLR